MTGKLADGSRAKALVIANRSAARLRQHPDLTTGIERACQERARFVATSSIEELDAVIAAASEEGVGLVAICGGDGSFMAGLTALARHFGEEGLPRIALLPAGTVATVATRLGIRGDLATAVRAALQPDARFRSHPTLRLELDEPADGVTKRLGFIFGTGLVASFFDAYYARGAGGLPAAARIVARVFAESFWGGSFARRILNPLPCRIRADDRELTPQAFSLVCASVLRDLGLGMRVTYRAGERRDAIHLVASPLRPNRLGPRVFRVLAGRTIGGPGHFDDLVGSFELSFDPEPGPFVLDGDRLIARRIRVSCGPHISVHHS